MKHTQVARGSHTAFAGHERIATGPLAEVARRTKERLEDGEERLVLIFDDETGRPVDVDFRGTPAEVAARVERAGGMAPVTTKEGGKRRTGPGRPRLGVVSREVSLLPRHWEWLGRQPGSTSATLRKLVEAARRESARDDRARQVRDAAYRFMHALGGDLLGFEEASRALFRGDVAGVEAEVAGWPADVRDHLLRMLRPLAHDLPAEAGPDAIPPT